MVEIPIKHYTICNEFLLHLNHQRSLTVSATKNMRFYFAISMALNVINILSNGNRTKWSPIRSVIIRVINKIRESDLLTKNY